MTKDGKTLLQTTNRAMQSAFGIYTNTTYQEEDDDEDDLPEFLARGQKNPGERGKKNV